MIILTISRNTKLEFSVLPSTAEYALRAVLHLAARGEDGPVRVGDIAEAVGVPRNYLSKIFHELARSGVLQSTRGQHGGFQLAVPPDHLSLADVVERFTTVGGTRTCLLGGGMCDDHAPCVAHARWKALSTDLAEFFAHTTVADLLRDPTRPASAA
jgi:Rrf2 family iron-sulfur cluster assembly transcriptional regulator